MPRRGQNPENLLKFVPARSVSFEETEDGRVVLLRPKFMTGLFAKFVQPRIKKKFFRVKLDDFGAATWRAIDGKRDVGEIADLLFERFGETVEPRYERLSKFVGSLFRGDLITLAPPDGSPKERRHGAG